ncbi:MAG: hypothetical protein BWY05_00967 [Euryarchaeota archaeon ADurb.Bin165]|nr:MAG: hypothetical protein BWY05_00967 [Euryarchaeota archaeon ADurb.Bin165]
MLKSAIAGSSCAVMYPILVFLSEPAEPVTDRETVYTPGF